MEAAHEKGITHRDLKPANIKVIPEGTVKLLDFGLAKLSEPVTSSRSDSPTLSPTFSLGMTQAGVILGTAGYMAPEQARGDAVDKRADIWAFGVVVYEMLVGAALFHGDTVSDTLAAVLRAEIDLGRLPSDTPAALRRILRRCLERDRKRRLPDIAMVRLELDELPEETATAPPAPTAPPLSGRLAWAVAAVLLVALAVLATLNWFRPKPAHPVAVRFDLPLPEGATENGFASGRTASAVASPAGRNKTDGASSPFWSPDGQYIAYFADDKLKKISLGGGSPQTICAAPHASRAIPLEAGGTWNSAGVIVFCQGVDALLRYLPARRRLSCRKLS